ncbi:helix-turn-helix domain-containing protein [Solibacillus silvestris]|uniref:helix-turn-helix domain-containing protein n=1 Tax=Solibacillus silvestris TaxID=76853 RepID=UPI003F7E47AB
MIQNNFRILLAKQKKKMADVEKETGLSKNTIRGLYYETSKGIQFSTLNIVCDYLDCEIGDLIQIKKEELV